jgi:hypothetical protein
MSRRAAIRQHSAPRRHLSRPAGSPPLRSRRPEAPPSLFDAIASAPEDAELLEDLMALVALGLLEERPSPEGPVYALTELARRSTP